MNKKQYQSPLVKEVKVKAQRVLCGSGTSKQRNEKYEEVDQATTSNWFNY